MELAYYVLLGLVTLVGGAILRYMNIPMNPLFGYRTPGSYSSPENWQYANRLAGLIFLIIGTVSLPFGMFSFYSKLLDKEFVLFGTLILIFLGIGIVEYKLYKRRKSKD